jgi:hypothetical protein
MSDSIELGFDLDALLGAGNKGAVRRRNKTEYLKPGTAFYRILPSFDPVDRRINFEYYMHWLTGEDGKKMKVQCTKGTEGYCPLCESAKVQEELFERAKLQGKPTDQVKMLEEASKALRASRSVYFNAVNAAGDVVALELNITATKLLAKKMEEAKTVNIDATHPTTGTWFRFSKNGAGRDAYEVDFKKINVMVDGESLEKKDRTPLTQDLIDRLPTAVTDLKNPENMYIQVFSSKDLANFLRGIPLKSKFQKRTQETDVLPVMESAPVEDVAPQAPVANVAPQVTAAQAPVVQAATTQAAATTISSAASEVARLRGLAQQK